MNIKEWGVKPKKGWSLNPAEVLHRPGCTSNPSPPVGRGLLGPGGWWAAWSRPSRGPFPSLREVLRVPCGLRWTHPRLPLPDQEGSQTSLHAGWEGTAASLSHSWVPALLCESPLPVSVKRNSQKTAFLASSQNTPSSDSPLEERRHPFPECHLNQKVQNWKRPLFLMAIGSK